MAQRHAFDVEILIEEVKKRPALYDKSMQKHSNIVLRKDLWREICQTVVSNWSELSEDKRNTVGVEVQQKWLNLRTCFSRELKAQKTEEARVQGSNTVNTNKYRRKYVHYERLLFLSPYMESNRQCDESLEDKDTNKNSDIDDNSDDSEEPIFKKAKRTIDTEYFGRSLKKNVSESISKSKESMNTKKSAESSSSQMKVDDKNRDEDMNFAISLVPMLKRLNSEDKLELKLQILMLFRNNSSAASDKGGSKPLNDGESSKRKRQDSSKQDDKYPLENSIKSSENECAAVGTSVEVKLRRMLSNQRLYAEHLINQTLYKGLLVQLNESSKIVTNKRQSERPTFVSVGKDGKNFEYRTSEDDNEDVIATYEGSVRNIKTRISDDSDYD